MITRKGSIFYKKRLLGLPYFSFMAIQFILLFFTHLLFATLMWICISLFGLENDMPNHVIQEFNILRSFAFLVIGAIFETSIFQSILYYAFCENGQMLKPTKYIFWSSLLFGLAHIVLIDSHPVFIIEFLQIIMHFFAGIIYATTYYLMNKRDNNIFISFISVALLHWTYNACITGFIWLT